MNTLWLAGLSHGNSGTAYGDIDFAFFFNGGGWAEIRENGAYQTDMPYAAGDVFRVGAGEVGLAGAPRAFDQQRDQRISPAERRPRRLHVSGAV